MFNLGAETDVFTIVSALEFDDLEVQVFKMSLRVGSHLVQPFGDDTPVKVSLHHKEIRACLDCFLV